MKYKNMKPPTRSADFVNYENLANAIVIQAVDDYKAALRVLLCRPNNGEAKHEAWNLEKFFHSQWYEMLTSLDPDRLIEGVKKLVENEEADKIRKRIERDAKDTKRIINIITALGGTVDANLHRYLNPPCGWPELLRECEKEKFGLFDTTIFEPPELDELFGKYNKEGADGRGSNGSESLMRVPLLAQGILAGSLVS